MIDKNKRRKIEKIRVASFFSGAGGLDLGFETEGFEIVFASDIEPHFCETLKLNKGKALSQHAEVLCADIRDIEFDSLPASIDLVIGGPPCQSFSASGRRAGGAAGRLDQRGNLFEAYARIIDHLKPKAFVFENVRGIFGTNKGKDWEHILTIFEGLDYKIDYRLLDAADYGTPQHRERVFLVGHKLSNYFLFPMPIFGPDSEGKTPHVTPAEAFKTVRNTNKELSETPFEGGKYSHLLREVPEGQNYLFFTAKRGYPEPKFAYRSRFSDFLYKADPCCPMKTVIASPGKYTGPLHWENRYFTVSEYKAIQGFPQDFVIFGERSTQIKQIGNAVSPLIAAEIAKAVKSQVFNKEAKVALLDHTSQLSFDKRKGKKAQITRKTHLAAEEGGTSSLKIKETQKIITLNVSPSKLATENVEFKCSKDGRTFQISAHYDDSKTPSVNTEIEVFEMPRDFVSKRIALIKISLFGGEPLAMQLFWNVFDEWVRLATSFQSLFELYGHFTEPYPHFRVSKFDVFSTNAFFDFARYTTDFANCSVYLPKDKLFSDLSAIFGAKSFDELAEQLRSLRYDIRTKETNVAIPSSDYLMAYPFTLPMSKQMNFAVKKPSSKIEAEAYIYEKRVQN